MDRSYPQKVKWFTRKCRFTSRDADTLPAGGTGRPRLEDANQLSSYDHICVSGFPVPLFVIEISGHHKQW